MKDAGVNAEYIRVLQMEWEVRYTLGIDCWRAPFWASSLPLYIPTQIPFQIEKYPMAQTVKKNTTWLGTKKIDSVNR